MTEPKKTNNRTRGRRRRVTKGRQKHWAVWLTFGIVFGVILYEAMTVISEVLPGV